MNSEESENQEAVVKSPKENASVESDESVEELGSVETGVGKNSTSGGPQSGKPIFLIDYRLPTEWNGSQWEKRARETEEKVKRLCESRLDGEIFTRA
jgi:hypothetical protein